MAPIHNANTNESAYIQNRYMQPIVLDINLYKIYKFE